MRKRGYLIMSSPTWNGHTLKKTLSGIFFGVSGHFMSNPCLGRPCLPILLLLHRDRNRVVLWFHSLLPWEPRRVWPAVAEEEDRSHSQQHEKHGHCHDCHDDPQPFWKTQKKAKHAGGREALSGGGSGGGWVTVIKLKAHCHPLPLISRCTEREGHRKQNTLLRVRIHHYLQGGRVGCPCCNCPVQWTAQADFQCMQTHLTGCPITQTAPWAIPCRAYPGQAALS